MRHAIKTPFAILDGQSEIDPFALPLKLLFITRNELSHPKSSGVIHVTQSVALALSDTQFCTRKTTFIFR